MCMLNSSCEGFVYAQMGVGKKVAWAWAKRLHVHLAHLVGYTLLLAQLLPKCVPTPMAQPDSLPCLLSFPELRAVV